MSLLKADYELRNIINWINENRTAGYNLERNKEVDYLITFDEEKWCLYDIIKGRL